MTGKAHSCMEVRLEEVRFHAYHGLLPQEAKVGNDFEADIVVTVPDVGTADDDSLDNSLCCLKWWRRKCAHRPARSNT